MNEEHESKLRVKMDRGQRAESLLDNELLQEAFSKIEEEIDRVWKNSKPEHDDVRRDAYFTYVAYERLKGYLNKIVTDGSAASKELIPQRGIFKR